MLPAIAILLINPTTNSPASPPTFPPSTLPANWIFRVTQGQGAAKYRKAWLRIYPKPASDSIPKALLRTFHDACPLAVDAMCYQPYRSLGKKSLAQVLNFGQKEQQMIEEASRRLAAGTDPGILPERFMIGAVRMALDRRLARPETLTKNFYKALASG